MLSLTKGIVVVDAHVDVHDYAEVMFYVGANVDPKRDVMIGEGPLDHLDHAPTLQFFGGKIGIDATAKGPLEGAREWPPGDRDGRRDPGARRPAVGRIWNRVRLHEQGTAGCVRVRAACYDVDPLRCTRVESLIAVDRAPRRPPARPGPEPVAGRLRRWRRRPPGRADHLVVGGRARRADRARVRVPLGARPDGGDGARARARGRARDRRRGVPAEPAAARGRTTSRRSATRARSSSSSRRSASAA